MIEVEAILQWYRPGKDDDLIDEWSRNVEVEKVRYNVPTVKEAYEKSMTRLEINNKEVIEEGWKMRKFTDRRIYEDTPQGAKQVGFIVPLGVVNDEYRGRVRARVILKFRKYADSDLDL